jgi:PiT family inorganic phosphate transporter
VIWFYLSSGLFLGWSLGANDAANIFGTAVGTKMVRFKTAASIASLFIIIGAVFSGSGTTETLEKLGAVNAIAGSFTVAFATALSIVWMTKTKLPVSTSQAIVGGIVGWNLFTGSKTDYNTLTTIVSSWVFSVILSAIFAMILLKLFTFILTKTRIHLLEQDFLIRSTLVMIGAFGAFSLGANNIANVMGVFVSASPFKSIQITERIIFSDTQQLFLLGSLAMGAGIYTYSKRVMSTVGQDLYKLTPISALVVVLAVSLVLFVFASKDLANGLISLGLPSFPLVPISSSQAIIGAIIGIGIAKGGKGINYHFLVKIALGWLTCPIVTCWLTFILLFFMQNVFEMQVVKP